jgi:hypothetical protein
MRNDPAEIAGIAVIPGISGEPARVVQVRIIVAQ